MEISKNRPETFVIPKIREMKSYTPGKQLNDPSVIKLNTNENPFPISDAVARALQEEMDSHRLHKYPEPTCRALREKIAHKFNTHPDRILVGNGSDEVLSILFRSLLSEGDSIAFSNPSYSLYPVLSAMAGARTLEVDVNNDWSQDFEGLLRFASGEGPMGYHMPEARLSIIANPNAPTGIAEPKKEILKFVDRFSGLTIVDEAYGEFGEESVMEWAGTDRFPSLLVTSTFSKTYSLAGARIGWVVAHPALIREFDKIRDSYNVSRMAQVAARAAVEDEEEIRRRIAIIKENRQFLTEELAKLGFSTLPSSANFIFTKPPAASRETSRVARAYYDFLEQNKILVRYFDANPRVRDYLRITIGTKRDMEILLEKTREFLRSRSS